MKRLISLLVLILCAAPVWAAKKTSVQELKDTLISLNQAKKTDEEIATRLKDTEMSEELTRSTLKDFAQYLPGPLSIEQIEVLEGRSALLPPPSSDLPSTPAPDLAGQKAILAKAVDYVTKTYMQAPHFTFYKSTARFQDGVENIRTNSGMTSNMPNAGNAWELPNMYMRFLGTHLTQVESDKGVEKPEVEKAKVPWGQNGQVSEGGLGPVLSIILGEAAAGGKLNWLRWESINGIPTAVFSFAVDKKKSHYEVNYCCFPVTDDTGRMGYEGTGANFQTATDWKSFKATVGYRGEFFIDPKTGTIVRLTRKTCASTTPPSLSAEPPTSCPSPASPTLKSSPTATTTPPATPSATPSSPSRTRTTPWPTTPQLPPNSWESPTVVADPRKMKLGAPSKPGSCLSGLGGIGMQPVVLFNSHFVS